MKKGIVLSVLFLSLFIVRLQGQVSAVTISGSHNVGSTLSAVITGAPASGNHVDYEWFYSPSGTSIGIGINYTVDDDDQGYEIYVVATENEDGTHAWVGDYTSGTILVNSKPVARYVTIYGLPRVGITLNGSYEYYDVNSDPQSVPSTTFQWYKGTSPGGAGASTIGTGLQSFTVTTSEIGSYIGFSVTPAASSGSTPGSEYRNAVWIGPVIANSAPVASNLTATGGTAVNRIVTGNYTYSDAEGDLEGASKYRWLTATNALGTDSVFISGATSRSFRLTNSQTGKYLGFFVQPASQSGTTPGAKVVTGSFIGPITNTPPTANPVTVTGGLNVGNSLTGHYVFADAEGETEDGTTYQWSVSGTSGGPWSGITGATSIVYEIALSDTGKYLRFSVTPKEYGGTVSGGTASNLTGYGPVNKKPYADNVHIFGTAAVGSTLKGRFRFNDIDGDAKGTCIYKWYRNKTTLILGANDTAYVVKSDDEGDKITFEVTPVSATGYPNTGNPRKSPETVAVIDPNPDVPVASQVCIQGTRIAGQQLIGKYLYTFPSKPEGTSYYRWLLNNVAITGATDSIYTITTSDISSGYDITFEVTPRSSNKTPKVGLPVKSDPLARITGLADSYSVDDPAITLTANQPNGVFSGHGVDIDIFTPADAGTAGSPHTITYNLPITYPSTTCTQVASQQVNILSGSANFIGFNNIYCHDKGKDTITVSGVPITAILEDFVLTDPAGIVSEDASNETIIIDVSKMRPGNKVDTLFFSYYDLGLRYSLFRPLIIDSVGTKIALVNLDPAYCELSAKRYITIENTYPAGGSASWTGALLEDKTATSAFLNPLLGTAGSDYPVIYQYTSPNGCKSTVISRSVRINPLPNSNFALDATYNIEGGAKDLVPVVSGGNFVGPGVVGTKFYPDIAGVGTPEIKYYLTDGNGCSGNTTKSTEVRRALGTIDNPPIKICYRDTTYNITVNSLPASSDYTFTNTKNSLEYTPGNTTAKYSVAAAGAGYDTLRFSYKWGGLIYTLTKTVFIDSIGKVVISGLRDNYCDYEGTVSLRVFVENSTGYGNFSFSGPDSSFKNYGNLADFYPYKTPTSATPYSVRYQHVSTVNSSGCKKTVELPVTVNKSPSVAITTARTTVNLEEPPFNLEGTPAGGVFAGKGIYRQGLDYVFNPAVAGLGNIEITFTYVDTKGCFSTIKDTLMVSVAKGLIDGINPNSQYCFDGADDTLKYVSAYPWLIGQFAGPGIIPISADQAIFRPSLAGKGDHKILFRYLDMTLTMFEVPAVLKVDSIGQVSINNLKDGEIFCNNEPVKQLFGSHAGGIFTGPVTGDMLKPSKGIGDTNVIFTYTNPKSGCSSSVTVPIVINPAPSVAFLPVDICIANDKDSTRFINNTTSVDPVSGWRWVFTDAGSSVERSKEAPAYLYKTGGLRQVRLIATTIKSCADTLDKTIDLGIKPVADFTWKNECFHLNDSIYFLDATVSPSTVKSNFWNFHDGGPMNTRKNPGYLKIDSGYLDVEYIVKTSYESCHDTIRRKVYVRPTIKITSDNYFEKFESGKKGWVKDYSSNNTWSFGTPGRSIIKAAYSGNNAWYTGYDINSSNNESSSIVSPCFDFTQIERPMISLQLYKFFDRNRDGATLQYKVGDSGSWEYVGSLNDGINWFDSPNIKGKPGGGQMGWSTLNGRDTIWTESRHRLDELQGKTDVKFRIAYGSDGTSRLDDGIAFDDIWIGERTRNVLLEHFLNISSAASRVPTQMVNTITENNVRDVINIQFHTNFPGADPFYSDNPGDANARILYYGLINSPYTFIDGGFDNRYYADVFDYKLASIDSNEVSRRSLISPYFEINLQSDTSRGILTVGGSLKALGNLNAENMTLYIAVTEKKNTGHTGYGGDKNYYNIFRKFIPDAGGIDLKKSWIKGETLPIPQLAWVIENVDNSADIEVIAFLQNNVTREVFQAASTIFSDIVVGINDVTGSNKSSFVLYPNPAVNNLTIRFSEPLTKDADMKIIDIRGIEIYSRKIGSGSDKFVINDLNLKQGIYFVRISRGNTDMGFRKLVVSGQ